MEKRLYVGNLSYGATEEELENFFGQVGTVVDVHIITDRETGRSRGFGFVEMADEASAKAAVDELDGKELGGRALKVNEAKPRQQRTNSW